MEELTQRDQQSPRIQIAGTEADIRGALHDQQIDFLEVDEAGNVELTLHAFEQSDIDRCVDALRARRLSILSIDRKSKTLEEAFLDVVLPPESES